jgi:hypothetical protein
LELEKDRIYQDAAKGQVGGWGIAPQQGPMMTRARQATVRAKRVAEVILQNLDSGETFKLEGAVEYDEALNIARNSGKVPKGFQVAVTEANDERIIVVCKKGTIVSGEVHKSAVTPPKSKPRAKQILPEKLVGKNPEAVFAPKQPIPEVLGTVGTQMDPVTFKRCRPRDIDPAVGSFDIKVEILRGPRKEIRVRKDANFIEILAETFRDVDLEEDDRITLVLKPPKFEDGAIFKLEKTSLRARIALEIPIWNGTTRRCGIEISPGATIAEIVHEAQMKIDNEPLEDAIVYGMAIGGRDVSGPWTQKKYELKPLRPISARC